jgi:hypothetical protein
MRGDIFAAFVGAVLLAALFAMGQWAFGAAATLELVA